MNIKCTYSITLKQHVNCQDRRSFRSTVIVGHRQIRTHTPGGLLYLDH